MNTENAKKILLEKEQSLLEDLNRLQGELAEPQDVADHMDEATSSEATGEASVEISHATDTLDAVRAALERIQAGTYGRCVICGRPIEERRLEAVPWTPYCLEDQARIDREQSTDNDNVTL